MSRLTGLGVGSLVLAFALFWSYGALVVSSHGPCTYADTRDAIQLLTAGAGLVAGVVAAASAFCARWRRAAWAGGVQMLLLALWFVEVFAICPG